MKHERYDYMVGGSDDNEDEDDDQDVLFAEEGHLLEIGRGRPRSLKLASPKPVSLPTKDRTSRSVSKRHHKTAARRAAKTDSHSNAQPITAATRQRPKSSGFRGKCLPWRSGGRLSCRWLATQCLGHPCTIASPPLSIVAMHA